MRAYFFGEIFKIYENQPKFREVVHPFLLYLMASAKLTPEEILELIQSKNSSLQIS